MRRQQAEEQALRQLTPYRVMRLQNCKSFKFRKGEMYPNIRPPVSQCNPSHTFTLLSSTMEANGCGPIDPSLLQQNMDNPYADSVPTKPKKRIEPPEHPCRDKERRLHALVLGDDEMTEKWSKLTPRELIRMHNCKTHMYQKSETYPTIRPPVSRCSVAKTAEWLVDALEDNCCGHLFDMEQDDVIDVWKQSPHKQTLSFYGVGPGIPPPEAVVFNKVISKCLDKVNTPKPARATCPCPKLKQKLQSRTQTAPCGGLVLNRPLLAVKLSKMPTVKRKLNAREALNYLYCPRPANSEVPFNDQPKIGLNAALGMEKPVAKSRHVLKRKHYYCDLKCGIAENKCTELEWMKYKAEPGPHDEAVKQEIAEMTQEVEPEPKNYDELYDELINCFEDDTNMDPACELYRRCCLKSTHDGSENGDVAVPTAGGRISRPPGWRPSRPSEKDEIKQPVKDETGKFRPHKNSKDGIDQPDLTDSDRGKPDIEKFDKDKPDKEKPAKEKPAKEKPDKEKPDKEKPDKEKPAKEKPDKEKPEKEKPEKEKPDKEKEKPPKEKPNKDKNDTTNNESGKPEKDKDKPKDKDKYNYDSDDEKGKPKPPVKPTEEKEEVVEKPVPPPSLPLDSDSDIPLKNEFSKLFTDKPVSQYKKPPKNPSKTPKTPKKPNKIETPDKDGKPSEAPVKDCPCEICEFMTRRGQEPDTPLIREMKLREKRRQLMEYYKQMCCRQRVQCPQYRAPLRKCDPIECDNTFCNNPKLGEYCDCLNAMYELQKLLGSKHCIVNNELRFNLEDLKLRICKRFSECL